LKAGEWFCPNTDCNNVNFAKQNVCKRCKTPKPAVQEPEPQIQQTEIAASASSASEEVTSGMQNIQIAPRMSPTKNSKYQSQFMIATSAKGSDFEGKRGVKCTLEVNYGKISLNKKMPSIAYHYDITFDPESPKKFLPFALDVFMREEFPNTIFGTDGRKNMYTAVKLMKNKAPVNSHEKEIVAVMGDRSKQFKVKIKFAGEKDLSILRNYKDPMFQNDDKPSDSVQVLDVILRSAFKNIRDAIPVSRGLYFAPNQRMDLGDGMELWLGL
jgi:hypothetical protein